MTTEKVWVNIIDILWPVGSLYYCLDGTDNEPANVLGGFWVQKIGTTLQVGNTTYVCWTRIA